MNQTFQIARWDRWDFAVSFLVGLFLISLSTHAAGVSQSLSGNLALGVMYYFLGVLMLPVTITFYDIIRAPFRSRIQDPVALVALNAPNIAQPEKKPVPVGGVKL